MRFHYTTKDPVAFLEVSDGATVIYADYANRRVAPVQTFFEWAVYMDIIVDTDVRTVTINGEVFTKPIFI